MKVIMVVFGLTSLSPTLQKNNKYFVEDPSKACIIVPNFEHTLAANEAGTAMIITKTLRNSDTWNRYGLPGSQLSIYKRLVSRMFTHIIYDQDPTIFSSTRMTTLGSSMIPLTRWWPRSGGPISSTGTSFYFLFHLYASLTIVLRPTFDISLAPPRGKSGEGLKDKEGKAIEYWTGGPDQPRDNKYFLTFLGTLRNHPIRQKIAKLFHDPANGVYIQVGNHSQNAAFPF